MSNLSRSWLGAVQGAFAAAATNGKEPAAPGGGLTDMLPLLLGLGLFFWLIVLRPQKKEKRERQRMLDKMKKGDRVVSIGGIHGKISDVDETHQIISVEVAPKLTMKFSRTAIQSVEAKDAAKKQEPKDKNEKNR